MALLEAFVVIVDFVVVAVYIVVVVVDIVVAVVNVVVVALLVVTDHIIYYLRSLNINLRLPKATIELSCVKSGL